MERVTASLREIKESGERYVRQFGHILYCIDSLEEAWLWCEIQNHRKCEIQERQHARMLQDYRFTAQMKSQHMAH